MAAYVLGILDEDEVDAFENHLAQCRRCALDLRDFAVLPDLLDEADANGMLRGAAGERPDGRSVRAMLDSVSEDRARRRRNTVLLAAAAAVLLVVLTAVVTVGLSSGPSGPAGSSGDNLAGQASSAVPGPSVVAKSDVSGTVTRTDPATGVWARLSAVPESWGTSVVLEVKGAKGPTRCELVARGRGGETVVVGSWQVGSGGGDKDPMRLNGSVGMKWHEISEFMVRDTKEGSTLVRLPTAS
ncbi:hypothetical protein SUDANB95_01620 [Actinosynnema sp. ALI-1.44]